MKVLAKRIYLGLIFLLAVLPKFSGDLAPRTSHLA
jgi:hypothetical protein